MFGTVAMIFYILNETKMMVTAVAYVLDTT